MTLRIAALAAAILVSVVVMPPAAADHGIKRDNSTGANRCKNADDPAKCEARNAAVSAAEESCKDKAGAEKETCVENAVCAKAQNPENCRKGVGKRTAH
jgi:hypothetical protein